MTALNEIEAEIEAITACGASDPARRMLELGEAVLEQWLLAKNLEPTNDRVEGFRLLALHRQGAKGDPSFHACRETCRELVYHYNLLRHESDRTASIAKLSMMQMVLRHIFLFISGKLQTAQLGEFCCSSRSLRLDDAAATS